MTLDFLAERIDRGLRLLERIAAGVESLAARPEPTAANDTEELWDVKQVATYLKCSVTDVYRKADAGEIPRLKLGGKVRFEPEAIRAYARGESQAQARVVPSPR